MLILLVSRCLLQLSKLLRSRCIFQQFSQSENQHLLPLRLYYIFLFRTLEMLFEKMMLMPMQDDSHHVDEEEDKVTEEEEEEE